MKDRLPFRFGTAVASINIAMTLGGQAASNTWVGTTNVWDTATTANWTSPTTWTADDDAVFGTPGAGGLALALTTVSAHNLDFATTGYSISGSTLTLTGTTPTLTTATDVSTSISSVVAGSSGLAKDGAGTLTLSGVNTYTGTTAANNGTLVVGPTAVVGNNGTVTQSSSGYSVASGATLRLDGSTVQGGTAFVIWDINPVSISAGGTLELFTTNTIHSNVGSNAILLYWGNSDQISGAGSLKKLGTGVIDINGNGTLNLFTGTINVNEGTLALQGPSTSTVGGFAVNVADVATLDIRTDPHKIGSLDGLGAVIASHGGNSLLNLGNSGANGNFGGNLSGPFALTKSGAGIQILGGTNSYTKPTLVNGGKLVIDGTSSNSAFTVASGGTLGGAGTIDGTVTVNSGGFIAPGSGTGSSISTLTINNNLTLAAGSKTTCEIQKTGVVLSNDQLLVNGVTYGGTLEVTASGDALVAGNEFKLFDATSYGGTFGTITLPTLPGGLAWDSSTLSTDGTIRVSNLAETPVFSPGEGTFLAPQTITMTSGSGTTVYYTFASGGAEPPNPTTGSASGTAGSGFATVNLPSINTWKVKAFATKPGLGNSLVALGTFTLIPTPVWTNTAGGFWSDLTEDATNWQNSLVANGSGIPADFSTLALTGDTTVTLDGDRTIGSLLFGDTGNQFDWTLEGVTGVDTLTLSSATPSIAVSNQTATITTPLSGSNGLTKTGAGELILAGGGGLSGGTAINDGTLTFKAPSNANWTVNGGAKTIASGATLKIDFSPQTTQFLTTIIGPTVVNGTLNLSGTAASANGWYVVNGTSALVASGAGNIEITDGGAVVINSAGALNGFTGAININGTSQLSLQGGTTSDTGTYAVNIATNAKFDLRTEGHTIGALNGSGSVIKSHNGFPGTGLFTIGNGNANGNFSGPMSAPAISYNVVKTGTGTQVLGGALTYGGTTTVNGGTLEVTGSLRLRPTTSGVVNTIGGTASLELDGTLDLDLSTANTTTGNSWLLVDVSNLSETYDAGFGLSSGGNPFAETSAGSGVWTLTSGSSVWTFTESTGTLSVETTSGYQAWIDTFVTLTGDDKLPGADPDDDGMSNLDEFAFKGDPTTGSNRGLTRVATIDANGNTTRELTLTVAVRTGATFAGSPSPTASIDGVTYTIEGSLTLGTFTTGVTETTALTPAQSGLPDITGSGWSYHTFTLTGSEGLAGKGFLRAKAEAP